MAYLIRTLYQHSFASTKDQAEDIAHQYIAEMVINKFPASNTWAKVIDCETQSVQTLTPYIPTECEYKHAASGHVITVYHTQFMNI